MRVLIIDDDELIAVSLCQSLAVNGTACDVACDMHSAQELMLAHSYDLILVDPYLTGGLLPECFAQIRAIQPEAAVVVATAYATAELREAADSGEIQLIEKPQPVATLADLVIHILSQSKKRVWTSPSSGVLKETLS